MEIDHHRNLDPVKFVGPFVYFSSFGHSSILPFFPLFFPFFFLFFSPPMIGGPYFRNGCTVAWTAEDRDSRVEIIDRRAWNVFDSAGLSAAERVID